MRTMNLSDILHDKELAELIKQKVDAYEEPTRRGVPKGDPIGMSKKKYFACYLMCLPLKRKQIAEVVGTSYDVMRKWCSEDDFKVKAQTMFQELEYCLGRRCPRRRKANRMNVEELVQERCTLEQKLQRVINDAIDEFTRNTGITVKHVDINMIEVTQLDRPFREFRVGRVGAQLELE